MNLLANLRPRIKLTSITHVRRVLNGVGKLSAKVGMEVTPDDTLGTSQQTAGFFVVKLAKALSVSPTNALKYLQRKLGSKIFKGELLAYRKSFLDEKIITAPTDGVLDFYDEKKGELRLKYSLKAIPLTAGVFGIVDAVNEIVGEVIIKTIATEILGLVGSGIEQVGIIHRLGGSSILVDDPLITPKLHGKIVVGGALIHGDALRKAAAYGLAGIITGGLNARDFKAMSGALDPMLRIGTDAGLTVLATEGFGSLPIGEDIFKYLSLYEGKFAFISGNRTRLWLPTTNPDSIIHLRKVVLPVAKGPERYAEVSLGHIQIGKWVRIIWPPFAGWQGRIVSVDQSPTTLPSGISTYNIVVETKIRKIKVPFPNVELIEQDFLDKI